MYAPVYVFRQRFHPNRLPTFQEWTSTMAYLVHFRGYETDADAHRLTTFARFLETARAIKPGIIRTVRHHASVQKLLAHAYAPKWTICLAVRLIGPRSKMGNLYPLHTHRLTEILGDGSLDGAECTRRLQTVLTEMVLQWGEDNKKDPKPTTLDDRLDALLASMKAFKREYERRVVPSELPGLARYREQHLNIQGFYKRVAAAAREADHGAAPIALAWSPSPIEPSVTVAFKRKIAKTIEARAKKPQCAVPRRTL